MAYRTGERQFDAPAPFIEGVKILQQHFDGLVDTQMINYDTSNRNAVHPSAPNGVLQLDPSLDLLCDAYNGLIHIADARSLARLSNEPQHSPFDIVRQHGPRVGRKIGYNPVQSVNFSTRPKYQEAQQLDLQKVRAMRRRVDSRPVASAGVTLAAEIAIGHVILPAAEFEPIVDAEALEIIKAGILRAKSKRQSAA